MKKVYVFIHETVYDGEHETGSNSVAEIDENTDMLQYKKDLAIEFFDLTEEEVSEELEHSGNFFSIPSAGDIRKVSYDIREIPKEHFDILKLYIL